MKAGRLRNAARRLRARFDARAIILLYHRIADEPADPYLLCVTPAHFAEHLQAVRDVAVPMPLAELARRLRERRLSERAVAITFDDGYQDNLYTARPLLERHDTPATVFMTAGEVGRTREFWWDELQRILLESSPLPETLSIEVAGRTVDAELGTAAASTPPTVPWNVTDARTPTPRHAALREIYDSMLDLSVAEQRAVLDRLLKWSGRPIEVRPTRRTMDADEMIRLEDGGLVDIGAHTVNHPALYRQPVDVQRDEIARSRSMLESALGHEVAGFAYPYGLYTRDSVHIVRGSGFDFACACIGHPVLSRSPNFELPRMDAPDTDGDTLARQLRDAFGH